MGRFDELRDDVVEFRTSVSNWRPPKFKVDFPDDFDPSFSGVKTYLSESFTFYKNTIRDFEGAFWKEFLSGFTVSILQVPESVAFSFVAGVPPLSGLLSTVFLGFFTAWLGGGPAMISGAAGALAVVVTNLTKDDGPLVDVTYAERLEILWVIVFFLGLFQMIFGFLGLARLAKLIPETAMLGFVNGLAIIIFMAQLSAFKFCDVDNPPEYFEECPNDNKAWLPLDRGETWIVIYMVAITMLVMQVWSKVPKVGKLLPGSLVALIVGTVLEHTLNRHAFGVPSRIVSETASLTGNIPAPTIPDFGLASRTGHMGVALQYGASLALIGIVESVMTLQAVNEIKLVKSSVFRFNQECIAQGVANFVCCFFNAMGGDAMIGQSTLNVTNGARGRLSGMVAGIFMLFIILGLSTVINLIPIASLTGLLFMVVIHTFNWNTFKILKNSSYKDGAVILLVTLLAVFFDLAIAVAAGIVLTALFNSWASAKFMHAKTYITIGDDGQKQKHYDISGPLFFGSMRGFIDLFDFGEDPDEVYIHFKESRICDYSAISAIRKVGMMYTQLEKEVHLEDLHTKSYNKVLRQKKHVSEHIRLGKHTRVESVELDLLANEAEIAKGESKQDDLDSLPDADGLYTGDEASTTSTSDSAEPKKNGVTATKKRSSPGKRKSQHTAESNVDIRSPSISLGGGGTSAAVANGIQQQQGASSGGAQDASRRGSSAAFQKLEMFEPPSAYHAKRGESDPLADVVPDDEDDEEAVESSDGPSVEVGAEDDNKEADNGDSNKNADGKV